MFTGAIKNHSSSTDVDLDQLIIEECLKTIFTDFLREMKFSIMICGSHKEKNGFC